MVSRDESYTPFPVESVPVLANYNSSQPTYAVDLNDRKGAFELNFAPRRK